MAWRPGGESWRTRSTRSSPEAPTYLLEADRRRRGAKTWTGSVSRFARRKVSNVRKGVRKRRFLKQETWSCHNFRFQPKQSFSASQSSLNQSVSKWLLTTKSDQYRKCYHKEKAVCDLEEALFQYVFVIMNTFLPESGKFFLHLFLENIFLSKDKISCFSVFLLCAFVEQVFSESNKTFAFSRQSSVLQKNEDSGKSHKKVESNAQWKKFFRDLHHHAMSPQFFISLANWSFFAMAL